MKNWLGIHLEHKAPDESTPVAWALFDGLNVYTGSLEPASTQCLPTPGAANQCGPTPARPGTWGRLKATYR